MSNRETLGFDRKIELAWLDAAAAATAREASPLAARRALFRMLEGAVAGDDPHSGRGKTVTVLARIWITVPEGVVPTKLRALRAIESATPAERLAIHWAMCSATHPLFIDVAAAVGRLLRLQGNVAQAQVLRRVSESWGERSTLHRAVQRLCRAYVDWGVLREGKERGVYEPAGGRLQIGVTASRLLIEGIVVGSGKPAWTVDEVVAHAALFPFVADVDVRSLRAAPEFRVVRQGVDIDLVGLASAEAQ